MKPEIHGCPKSHIDIEGNIVFTWAFKFDTTDNEVDGFSLMNMKESDIFLMIPGKEIMRNVNKKLRDSV